MRAARQGFSLLEMGIVLVIIGLMAGGIIGGRSLLEASRHRSVITQTTAYAVALQQFRQQYGQLPGDFPEAARVWGRADGGSDLYGACAAPGTAVGDGRSTCNGNGDGMIHGNEAFRAWQQMANAGFIVGSFTGRDGSGGAFHAVANENAPAGQLMNSTYGISSYARHYEGDALYFDGPGANVLTYGQQHPSDAPRRAVMKPREAYNIDIKTDDGRPAFGLVRTIRGTFASTDGGESCVAAGGGDVAGGNASNSEYRRGQGGILCFLMFLEGFALDGGGVLR